MRSKSHIDKVLKNSLSILYILSKKLKSPRDSARYLERTEFFQAFFGQESCERIYWKYIMLDRSRCSKAKTRPPQEDPDVSGDPK